MALHENVYAEAFWPALPLLRSTSLQLNGC